MTKGELQTLARYLDAIQGSEEAEDALAELIGVADAAEQKRK
jgi:hypothetical protein